MFNYHEYVALCTDCSRSSSQQILMGPYSISDSGVLSVCLLAVYYFEIMFSMGALYFQSLWVFCLLWCYNKLAVCSLILILFLSIDQYESYLSSQIVGSVMLLLSSCLGIQTDDTKRFVQLSVKIRWKIKFIMWCWFYNY